MIFEYYCNRCGKSSLVVALFRFEELCGGRILVDGVDISQIPIHLLRSRLAIIPQDPFIFSVSIRSNIDPFDQFTDDEVWKVLNKVHLGPYVRGLKGNLQFVLSEGGENLSVGQREVPPTNYFALFIRLLLQISLATLHSKSINFKTKDTCPRRSNGLTDDPL